MDAIAKNHHVNKAWDRLMSRIQQEMTRRGVAASHTVVLLPYAQLMRFAKGAWLRQLPSDSAAHFLPRFETTQNWCKRLGAHASAPDDLKLDAARDALTAASLLVRAGLQEHQKMLSPRLMEAAWSLARPAAAIHPQQRAQWGIRLGNELHAGLEGPVLAHEAALGRLALAWAASSNYPTDVLFDAKPDLLVMLEGFQSEPLSEQLHAQLGDRVLRLTLKADPDAGESEKVEPGQAQPPGHDTLRLHAALDAEDEARRAAACVLEHLLAGRCPVALVAQDRQLTRRVHALLAGRGVRVVDETGWRLSTTRSAALVMGLLRACAWHARCDDALDLLKNAPAFDAVAVTQFEQDLRQSGGGLWRDALGSQAFQNNVARQMQTLRDALKTSRTLRQWLPDLRQALEATGLWAVLLADQAGQRVIESLRLKPLAEVEFSDIEARLSLAELQAWVNQILEAQSFSPKAEALADPPQLYIVPLSQLLGRPMAAVVYPGCDEVHLPISPDPGGLWMPDQRRCLGLPSREQIAVANRQAWRYALGFAHIDILWRQSDRGEKILPSPLVGALRLQTAASLAPDPSLLRELTAQPSFMPLVRADRLVPTRISSSEYEDLRRCPYRFFALRQLKLKEAQEIDTEVDKRDVGNWLHRVLKQFHEALQANPVASASDRLALINACAEQARLSLGLSRADFLPFAAAWPRMRDGYLQWHEDHMRAGAQFLYAEAWKEMPLGRLMLVGKIDRVDRQADGALLVIDYKTENANTTAERIKIGLEDTQLAFYAALLPEDTLSAAYVNVSERVDGKAASKTYAQTAVVEMRDELLHGLQDDMQQIAQGALLKAMGEGRACEHCAARGLCRKDFWETLETALDSPA
jgi:ATP-dependent helicase/nuclease subunit B